jgi:hypothetical protein
MIRAIIGTVAVVAGFAVVETTVDASTGPAGSCKATDAYVLLHSGEHLAVRAEPTPGASVVGELAAQDRAALSPSVVTLTGSRNGWARIALKSPDYTAVGGATAQYGWVPADLLFVSSRGDGPTKALSRPGLLGFEVARFEGRQTFRVLGCHGALLHVINAEQGNVWIDRWSAKSSG